MPARLLRLGVVSLVLALGVTFTFAAAQALPATSTSPALASAALLAPQTTTTPPRPESLSFGQGSYIQIVDPDGRRSVDFWVSPLGVDVPFTLHALPEDRLRAVYAASETWRPLAVDLAGLTQVAAWTESVTPQRVPPRTLIPATVPPGVYVLSAGSDAANRPQLIVVVTRYVALLKGGEGQVAVWTRRLQDGAPPPAPAQIQVVKNDATLAQMTADGQGWASADLVWDDKMLALVWVGGDLTVVGFRYEWQNDWSRWWGGGGSPYQDRRVYLYTDRPIYRPDQEVYFKAVLRQDSDGAYSLPLPTDAVTVTLKDPRANVVGTRRLTVGEFGSVDGLFRLGREASLGTYQLEVAYAGLTASRGVEVQAYRKPEYEVTVAATPNPLILGDPLRVAVNAAYYFNAPVPNAPLTVKLKYSGGWWWGGQGVAEVSGVTDEQGRWSGELPTGNVSPYNTTLTVEASVTDATGQVVTGQTSVQGYWASVDLQSAQARYAYQPGETVSVGFTARDRQGQPVGGQAVNLTITRYFAQEPTRSPQTLVTDASGEATLTLPNIEAGWYNLTAVTKDSRGRENTAYAYWWVFQPGQGGWWTQDGQIELQADALSYKPGDTARLLVRAPLSGPALLTLERGRVRREQVVQLTGGATLVEVPLTEGDAPNVFARLHVWQPYRADQTSSWGTVPEGRLLVSNALELPVAADARRLTVGVQADKTEYRPGETAVLTLDVRTQSGQGQRAEVSVALVDEAIYALASDTTADPFDHFYGRRALAVSGWDSLRPTRYGAYRDTLPAPTGTPAPGGPAVPPNAPGPGGQPVRQDFRDTAYWNAAVVTDAQGHAVVSVPLPDNLTRWRVVVRAVTVQTQAGQGQASLLVTKPLAVSPGIPRFLVLGDRVSLDTVVTNRTGAAVNAGVNLTGAGLLRLSGPPLTLVVPAGGQRSVSWSAVASQVGPGTLLAEADAGTLGDAVATPLPVQPFAVPERQAQAGLVEGGVDLRFDVPLNAVSESSTAELRLAPSVALSLLDGLDELVGYPYGCVEQTMSRVLPNAAVAQTYRRLGIRNPDLERRLPDIMADGLQRLYGFQRPESGWGWWYDDDSAVYQTTYVLFGLLQVRAAGFDVSDAVLQRGLDWLQNALAAAAPSEPTRTPTAAPPRATPGPGVPPTPTATPDLRTDTGLDPRLRAYALYVLALGGRPDLPQAQRLLSQPDRLDAFALAALALTLHQGGDTAGAEHAADLLAARAIETTGRVHWAAATDSAYLWRTMQSDEKVTGMALRGLAQIRPTSPLLPGAARWLMDQRRGQGWSTTQGTAFAVLGLTDYILVSGELDADYTWRVVRNGVVLAQGHVDRSNATQPIPPILLRGADLMPGENTLQVEKTGAGKLYYSLSVRLSLFYPQFEPVSSADTGIRLSRSYSLSEPGPGQATPRPAATATPGRGTALPIPYPSPTPTRPPQTEFRLGDVAETRLVVETTEEMSYVLIEDRLPAGFEPLFERVNPSIWDGGPWPLMPVWRDYGYNRKELRDDRVTFFVTWLGAGRHEFTYRLRATRPGLFSALPAEAYPMYRPDIWGRSASDQLTVERGAFLNPPPMKVDVDRSCAVTGFDVRQVVQAWETQDGGWRTEDGRAVSVAEVARAQANLGRTCLTGETPALDPVAMMPSLRLVPATTDPLLGQPFTVDVVLDGASQTRGYQASLSFDPNMVRLEGVDGLAGAVTLGALIDAARGQARWGVVLAEPTAGMELVVGRLRLTALQPGALDLALRDALVLDAHDQPHTPTLSGVRLVVGGFRLWLPLIKRGER